MSLHLNNLYEGTRSQKLYRVPIIKNYIVQRINESQNVKRLCRYMTKTPLYKKGKDYAGKFINQPDLQDSLLTPTVNDVEAIIKDAVLVPYSFTEDVLDENRLTIYVHSPRSTFNPNVAAGRASYGTDSLLGKHLFMIEIVYPTSYNEIEPYGQERAFLIACEILDLLDNLIIDEDLLTSTIGECLLKIEGEITNLRLAKAGYMILSIPVWATISGVRANLDEF